MDSKCFRATKCSESKNIDNEHIRSAIMNAIATNNRNKHITSTHRNESKQREIKQIVPLNAQKLKDLGIESNILSALTKFNGKNKKAILTESVAVDNLPSTSKQFDSVASSQLTSSTTDNIVLIPEKTTPNTRTESSSVKKIQVLSDYLLSDNKILDLKYLKTVAESKTITNVIIPVERNEITLKSCDEEQQSNDSDKDTVIAIEQKAIEQKVDQNSVAVDNIVVSDEISDRFLGFSSSEWMASLNHLDLQRNESLPATNVHSEDDSKEHIEPANDEDLNSSNSDTSFSDAISDDSLQLSQEDSVTESESDIEDLIEQARLTIENDEKCNNEKPLAKVKRPRILDKELIDLLAEHVDKNKIIDEFLELTKNSFSYKIESAINDEESEHDTSTENEFKIENNSEDSDDDDLKNTFQESKIDCESTPLIVSEKRKRKCVSTDELNVDAKIRKQSIKSNQESTDSASKSKSPLTLENNAEDRISIARIESDFSDSHIHIEESSSQNTNPGKKI